MPQPLLYSSTSRGASTRPGRWGRPSAPRSSAPPLASVAAGASDAWLGMAGSVGGGSGEGRGGFAVRAPAPGVDPASAARREPTGGPPEATTIVARQAQSTPDAVTAAISRTAIGTDRTSAGNHAGV